MAGTGLLGSAFVRSFGFGGGLSNVGLGEDGAVGGGLAGRVSESACGTGGGFEDRVFVSAGRADGGFADRVFGWAEGSAEVLRIGGLAGVAGPAGVGRKRGLCWPVRQEEVCRTGIFEKVAGW